MRDPVTKLPIKEFGRREPGRAVTTRAWDPFANLHSEIDRLFSDFERGSWRPSTLASFFDIEPFSGKADTWMNRPAMDVVEKAKSFEITAELPGLNERDIEVTLTNGVVTIAGEKKEEREDRDKGYYVAERRYGSFQRSVRLPEGADAEKLEANFKNGVLTLTVPKTAAAQQSEKKIAVKAA